MAGFSGYAFREIIRLCGGCGLTTTEMVNARSFIQIEKNLRHSPPRLWGIPTETRPIAVQIWDNVPENLAEVGRVLAQIWKVSIVDINFGCPSPTVAQRSQSGSYLLDFPDQVEKIVRLTVDACAPTPVTVKMRLGTKPNRITACEVAQAAESAGAAERATQLRAELSGALDALLRTVVKGAEDIFKAINDSKVAEKPEAHAFETESAAEIFASIVNDNQDAVRKAFSGFWNQGKLKFAFSNALKDDKNHMTDGHQKVKTNKL